MTAINPADLAHRAATADAHPIGAVTGLQAALDGVGKVVYDVTLNAAWKVGTPSIDPATGIITLAGHGFANNVPVEFGAGTGALPTGIAAYDSRAFFADYYNVINATTDTFQITSTVGGTTPVIPSDAGTAGWQVRGAYPFISFYGRTDFALPEIGRTLTFGIFGEMVKMTTAVASYGIAPRQAGTMSRLVYPYSPAGASAGAVMHAGSPKYTNTAGRMSIHRAAESLYFIETGTFSVGSTDRATFTAIQTYALSGGVLADSPATIGYSLVWNIANAALPRNGFRIIGWRS